MTEAVVNPGRLPDSITKRVDDPAFNGIPGELGPPWSGQNHVTHQPFGARVSPTLFASVCGSSPPSQLSAAVRMLSSEDATIENVVIPSCDVLLLNSR